MRLGISIHFKKKRRQPPGGGKLLTSEGGESTWGGEKVTASETRSKEVGWARKKPRKGRDEPGKNPLINPPQIFAEGLPERHSPAGPTGTEIDRRKRT